MAMKHWRWSVLVLAGVLIALVFPWNGGAGVGATVTRGPSRPSHEDGFELDALRVEVGLRTPAAPASGVSTDDRETRDEPNSIDDQGPRLDMVVRGTLFSHEATPVPRAKIGFELSNGAERTTAVYGLCNQRGEFEMNIGAGTWTVLHAGQSGASGFGRVVLGTVTIQSGGDSAYFDFYLPGDRSLAGAFSRPDRDLAFLEVEIFDVVDLLRPVARAHCTTNEEAHDEYLRALEVSDHDVPPPAHSPGRGRFEVSGLAPAYYEIRVYMDVQKRFYVSGQVDLTGSDHECLPVEVEQADFLRRKRLIW